MRTKATYQELEQALNIVNKLYDDNVIFNRHPEYVMGWNNFTLRVRDSKGPGAKISQSGRRSISACWHIHGHFFEALFTVNPESVLKSVIGEITKAQGNWQDSNIGSFHSPKMYSECCECEGIRTQRNIINFCHQQPRLTIYDIKRMTSDTSPHYFTRKTMNFFGQTLKDFSVERMKDKRYLISAATMGGTVSKRHFNPYNNELEIS